MSLAVFVVQEDFLGANDLDSTLHRNSQVGCGGRVDACCCFWEESNSKVGWWLSAVTRDSSKKYAKDGKAGDCTRLIPLSALSLF